MSYLNPKALGLPSEPALLIDAITFSTNTTLVLNPRLNEDCQNAWTDWGRDLIWYFRNSHYGKSNFQKFHNAVSFLKYYGLADHVDATRIVRQMQSAAMDDCGFHASENCEPLFIGHDEERDATKAENLEKCEMVERDLFCPDLIEWKGWGETRSRAHGYMHWSEPNENLDEPNEGKTVMCNLAYKLIAAYRASFGPDYAEVVADLKTCDLMRHAESLNVKTK